MKIHTAPSFPGVRAPLRPPQAPPPSPFHDCTGFVAGAAAGSLVGLSVAHRLQLPTGASCLVGAGLGAVAGLEGALHGGRLYHATSAAVAGGTIGLVGGALALASLAPTGPCNPEILIYGAVGALVGGGAGAVAGALASRHFPD